MGLQKQYDLLTIFTQAIAVYQEQLHMGLQKQYE